MWAKTHSMIVKGVEPFQIWQIWSNINKRHLWDTDIEWAKITEPFATGAIFHIKPKRKPKMTMEIIDCIPNRRFIDYVELPFARMYRIHRIEELEDAVRISTTIRIEGFLSFVWKKLLAEKLAVRVPKQIETLITLAVRAQQDASLTDQYIKEKSHS